MTISWAKFQARCRIAVVDELGWVGLGEDARDLCEERLALGVAVGAEAGGDAIEVAVVVSGVTAEFMGASGWKGSENQRQRGGVEFARSRDGDRAIGGADAALMELERGLEAWAQAADELDGEPARASALLEVNIPLRFKRITDGADGGLFGDFEERAGDRGEEVGVLVGVEVGDLDSGALELLDLGESFAGDFF